MPVRLADGKFASLECRAPTSTNDLIVPVLLSDGKFASIKVTAVTKQNDLGFVTLLSDGKFCLVKPVIDSLLYGWWLVNSSDKALPVEVLLDLVPQTIVDIVSSISTNNLYIGNNQFYLSSAGDVFTKSFYTSTLTKLAYTKKIKSLVTTDSHNHETNNVNVAVAVDGTICILWYPQFGYDMGYVTNVTSPNIISIGSGSDQIMACVKNGTFYLFQGNYNGESGNGDDFAVFPISSPPLFTAVEVASKYGVGNDIVSALVAYQRSYLIDADGNLYTAGRSGPFQGYAAGYGGSNGWTEMAKSPTISDVSSIHIDQSILLLCNDGTVKTAMGELGIFGGNIPIEYKGIFNVSKFCGSSVTDTNGETRHRLLKSTGTEINKYVVVPYLTSVLKSTGMTALLSEHTEDTARMVYWLWADYYNTTTDAYQVAFVGTTHNEVNNGSWEMHGTTNYGTTKQSFSGTGIDDGFFYVVDAQYYMSSYIETGVIKVKISVTGATDKFSYSIDGGTNYRGNYDITGGLQSLLYTYPSGNNETGIAIKFNSTTGHTLGDVWTIAQPKTTASPSTPTIYYYYYSYWVASTDIENTADTGWSTPVLAGKSTVGTVYDWTTSEPSDRSKCTTSASIPSAPTVDPDESFIRWEAYYDCNSADWYVYPESVDRSYRGRFYKWPTSNPGVFNYNYSTNVSGEYGWQESQIAGVYERATSGFPPQALPAGPTTTPTCYHYWVAEYYGGTWYLYDYGADNYGPASDWSCEYYEEWDYASCWRYTTSSSQPADPPDPPWA
jgi:hypothetical protein